MDIVLIIIALIFVLAGLIGCVIPAIPGPPLSYIALLLIQLTSYVSFSTQFMLIWLAVVLVVTALDYFVPIWGTKRFGGSKYGTVGSTIGVVLGLFFMPWGIIVMPFLGAFIGELIKGQTNNKAFKSAFGSFVGFVFGTLLKIISSSWIAYVYFKEVFSLMFK